MFKHPLLASLLVFASACGITDPEAGDGESDRFVSGDGKSDTGGIQEGTDDALGVLQVVNTLSKADLTSQVGLASMAVKNIDAYRLGDDGVAGTADDEKFETLRELDTIPYVGPIAFGKLLTYATAQGFTDNPPPIAGTDDPFDPSSCQGTPMSQTTARARAANQANLGSYQISMRTRTCTGPSGGAPCSAWSPVDLGTVSWRTHADGTLALFDDGGTIRVRTAHDVCNEWNTPMIDGSDCDGVGHTIYCANYAGYGQCGGHDSPSGAYDLPNGHSFAFEGNLTENCARLHASALGYYPSTNEDEVAILVRF